MNTFYIKEGDLWPPLEANLKQANGEPIPLQETDVIKFVMTPRKNRNITTLDVDVTVVDYATGHVKYDWVDGDIDVAGQYQGEFVILLDGVKTTKVPNNGYFNIVIDSKLGEEGGIDN